MVAAACPFQNQTLCVTEMSSSVNGSDTPGTKRIWPRWLTETLAGDFAASAGSFMLCLAENVAGSYSTISPVARKTQRRLPCAKTDVARRTRQPIQTDGLLIVVLRDR